MDRDVTLSSAQPCVAGAMHQANGDLAICEETWGRSFPILSIYNMR